MKKLFSIFCSLLLSAGMVVQAQLLDAVNDSPEGGYLFDENGQISGRHNAPQADMTINFDWLTEFRKSESKATSGKNKLWLISLSEDYVATQQIGESTIQLFFAVSSTYNYGAITAPPVKTYNVVVPNYDSNWSNNIGKAISSKFGSNGNQNSSFTWWTNSYYYSNVITGGSIVVDRGTDGYPYITLTEVPFSWYYSTNRANFNFYGSGYTQNTTIGSQLPKYSISIKTDNESYGKVGFSDKNLGESGTRGSFYTSQSDKTNITINPAYRGDVITLTAAQKSGYRFVCWKKGSTQISTNASTDVTIDGNATYTAYFEALTSTNTITLNNQSATTAGTDSVTATLNANTNLTGTITVPTKTNCHFGGYYTGTKGRGVQIINASGSFNALAGGDNTYLDASKNWKYGSNITLYAYWYDVISTAVSPTGYGTVSGANNYAEDTTATLTAFSANEHLYFFDHWLLGGKTFSGNTSNPLTITVTADTTYTAVFRDAKAGTITATVNNASYGTATASPSDNQPGGTAVTLTASAKSGYAFTGWDDNNDGVVDTTDAVRTVYVDGDKEYVAKFVVETASWANYSYDNAQDIIQRDIYQESSVACKAYYSPAGQKFVEVIAVNKSRSTKNYLQLYFKTTTTNYTYPDGEIGPTPGTYLANSGVGDRITSDLVLCPGDIVESNLYFWNWNSWPYECVIGYFKDNTGTGLGENDFSAFLADVNYSSQKPSTTNTYQIGNNNFRIIVDTGKDGHMYLQVRRVSNNELLVNIGEPAQHYNLAWDANGGELSGTYTAAGSYEAGATITAPTTTKPGYILTQWRDTTNSVNFNGTMPSNNVTYTAQWEVAERTVTITAPTGGTITVTDGTTAITSGSQAYSLDSTITLTATPATDYEFVSWNSGTPALADETTEDGVVSGTFTLTKDTTVGATFRRVRYDELTLEDNRDAVYYNTFVDDYNGVDVETVTYNRTFAANTWSTVCLPFYVDADNLSGAGWLGSVYEFKHAEGTANVDDGLYLNFYPAREMEAGKGYLVYSQGAALEGGFEFYDVKIDTDADTEPTITNLAGYNDGQGTITLVGTLRQGTLTPNTTSQMALKDNKVWYPGSGTTTIRAYRGFFKDSSGSSIPPRVHIVVEGEVVTDLEIMENGELRMDNAEVRKYIDNGVLIIERNGIRYDAQGKRIEN